MDFINEKKTNITIWENTHERVETERKASRRAGGGLERDDTSG